MKNYQWYIYKDEQEIGPISHAEFKKMIQSKQITGDTHVWREGLAEYVTLRSIISKSRKKTQQSKEQSQAPAQATPSASAPVQNPQQPEADPQAQVDQPQPAVQPEPTPQPPMQASPQQPQQDFAQPQQGYVPPQQGFAQPQQGYVPPQQGFAQPQQGYVPPQQGYVPPQQGFAQPQQGYVQPQQGFAPPELNLPPAQAEFEKKYFADVCPEANRSFNLAAKFNSWSGEYKSPKRFLMLFLIVMSLWTVCYALELVRGWRMHSTAIKVQKSGFNDCGMDSVHYMIMEDEIKKYKYKIGEAKVKYESNLRDYKRSIEDNKKTRAQLKKIYKAQIADLEVPKRPASLESDMNYQRYIKKHQELSAEYKVAHADYIKNGSSYKRGKLQTYKNLKHELKNCKSRLERYKNRHKGMVEEYHRRYASYQYRVKKMKEECDHNTNNLRPVKRPADFRLDEKYQQLVQKHDTLKSELDTAYNNYEENCNKFRELHNSTLIGYLQSAFFLVGVIMLGLYLKTSYRNLKELKAKHIKNSPGGAIGWLFCPIMNLFKPLQIFGEIITGSLPKIDINKLKKIALLNWLAYLIVPEILKTVEKVSNFDVGLKMTGIEKAYFNSKNFMPIMHIIAFIVTVGTVGITIWMMRKIAEAQEIRKYEADLCLGLATEADAPASALAETPQAKAVPTPKTGRAKRTETGESTKEVAQASKAKPVKKYGRSARSRTR